MRHAICWVPLWDFFRLHRVRRDLLAQPSLPIAGDYWDPFSRTSAVHVALDTNIVGTQAILTVEFDSQRLSPFRPFWIGTWIEGGSGLRWDFDERGSYCLPPIWLVDGHAIPGQFHTIADVPQFTLPGSALLAFGQCESLELRVEMSEDTVDFVFERDQVAQVRELVRRCFDPSQRKRWRNDRGDDGPGQDPIVVPPLLAAV